jgi:hypothetical protein
MQGSSRAVTKPMPGLVTAPTATWLTSDSVHEGLPIIVLVKKTGGSLERMEVGRGGDSLPSVWAFVFPMQCCYPPRPIETVILSEWKGRMVEAYRLLVA